MPAPTRSPPTAASATTATSWGSGSPRGIAPSAARPPPPAPGPAAEIPAGLRFREAVRRRIPTEDEIERGGTIVLLRAIPLMPGADRGTLVLARDATEL